MKIVYITGVAPFGPHEAFFIPEMVEWLRQGHELLVIPRQVSGPSMHREAESLQKSSLPAPLFNGKIAMGALGQWLRRPLRSLGALGLLFNPRGVASLAIESRRLPQGALDRPLGQTMGGGPHSRPLGDDDGDDGDDCERDVGDTMELHGGTAATSPATTCFRPRSRGRPSSATSPRADAEWRNRSEFATRPARRQSSTWA